MSQLGEDTLEPEQLDDPESGWTWFLSLASIVLLVTTVVAVTVIFYFFRDLEIEKKDRPAVRQLLTAPFMEAQLDEYAVYQVIPIGEPGGRRGLHPHPDRTRHGDHQRRSS